MVFSVNCMAKLMSFEIILESSSCTKEIQLRYYENNVAKYGFLSNQNNIFSNFSSVVDCQTFYKLLTLNDRITIVRKNGSIGYEENFTKSNNISFDYSSINYKKVSHKDMLTISIIFIFLRFCIFYNNNQVVYTNQQSPSLAINRKHNYC